MNSVLKNPENPQEVIVDIILPFNVGDFWIRKWGLFDEDGSLVAVGPHAEFYKPVITSGQAAEILERIILPVTRDGSISLTIASQALATQEFVDNQIQGHDQSKDSHAGAFKSIEEHINAEGDVHKMPVATTTGRGIARTAIPEEIANRKTGENGPAFVTPEGLLSPFVVGEFYESAFEVAELPFGLYFRNGDRYALDSPQGKVLLSMSENWKTNHGITEVDNTINLPTAFHSDGRGCGGRTVNGVARKPGSVELDAMQRITGEWQSQNETGVLNTSKWNGFVSGCFGMGTSLSQGLEPRGGITARNVTFDNAYDGIRTATENRMLTMGDPPCVYLGV